MLVAVIMSFLILSFTGVAVLDISYNSQKLSLTTVHNIKAQFVVESEINKTLWLINSGADSTVVDSTGNIRSYWDSETQSIFINVDTLGYEISTKLNLKSDNHFNHQISSKSGFQTNGYAYGVENDNATRRFNFLPEVDLNYYLENAVAIYHGNEQSWKESDLSKEGIHVFTGNNLTIDSRIFSNSTLVFTGSGLSLTNTVISAPSPDPENEISPAPGLVFTNPNSDFTVTASNYIIGTIYSAGQLNLEDASITGPIVADIISLYENIELMSTGNEDYFNWTAGFGAEDAYDWPKNVERWETTKWEKKHSS